jgi:hypothetical protein
MSRRRIVILVLGTIAAIGLLLIVLTGRKLPQVKGSLSQDDAREILNEFHRARWGEAHASLTNRQFRLFWRSASENFRLRLVSVEGDTTQAAVRCRYRSDRNGRPQGVWYEFTNYGGGWSFTSVTHWDGFELDLRQIEELKRPAKNHETITHQPP